MDWLYNGTPFTDPGEFASFVYLIVNKTNGKGYIGKKTFWSTRTKTVKGKKKRSKVESDWKSYWSSSNELKADVKLLGEENFSREILHLCGNKGLASYLEAKEQILRGVLENDSWYNSFIMCRIHKSHIKALDTKESS